MANSPLVNIIVPAHQSNYSPANRRTKITNVCWHHMAGVLTAQQCGNIFARAGRNGSAHYGIGSDGQIGLYVPEDCVAWHAGNWPENQCSIGIEISNSALGGSWPISDASFNLAITLTADIMKRNGIKKAVVGQTLTYHSLYSATTCPGDDVRSRLNHAADEINKILGQEPAPAPTPAKDDFLPPKGYWKSSTKSSGGDKAPQIGSMANFMLKVFPKYTSVKAKGDYFGPNLRKAIIQFQKNTHLEADGCVGPITYAKLKEYGFRDWRKW